MQAVQKWCQDKPDLFVKKEYNQTGIDNNSFPPSKLLLLRKIFPGSCSKSQQKSRDR
jgi:hypothetical protein